VKKEGITVDWCYGSRSDRKLIVVEGCHEIKGTGSAPVRVIL
jgi:hypothetical protein